MDIFVENLRMLKIEFDQPDGIVKLESDDGINVALDGPYEKVNSKNLEDALLFVVKILRITNKEQEPDKCLPSYETYMEITGQYKDAFETERLEDILFRKQLREQMDEDMTDFRHNVNEIVQKKCDAIDKASNKIYDELDKLADKEIFKIEKNNKFIKSLIKWIF